MTPDGAKPLPTKRYYDILSWLVTQLTMTFVVMPFIFLSFSSSIQVWRSVYFYGVVGNILSIIFFASPAKAYLIRRLKKRNKPHFPRTASTESIQEPTLGLPNDPAREIDDAVQEIKAELEARRRHGSVVGMPTGEELKAAVEDKLGRKIS